MNGPDIVLLYSGGLDSFIAYHHARTKAHVLCLRVDLDHPYSRFEAGSIERSHRLDAASRLEEEELRTVKIEGLLGDLVPQPDAANLWIPARNLLLATIGAMCSPKAVWIAALKGEMHERATDKNERFFSESSKLLNYVLGEKHLDSPLEIVTPFANLSKLDIVRYALHGLKLSPESLVNTWSCLGNGIDPSNPFVTKPMPCGNCMVCVRRRGIFAQTGLEEEYQQEPYLSPNGSGYVALLQESAKLHLSRGYPFMCDIVRSGSVRVYGRPIYDPARIDEVLPHWRWGNLEPAL